MVVFRSFIVPAAENENENPVRAALIEFCKDIEACGGVSWRHRRKDGYPVPCPDGNPSWTSLGYTYLRACKALGRTPMGARPW